MSSKILSHKQTIFTLLAVSLIVIMGFAVYSNSLGSGFVGDDRHLIENNTYIKDWKFLPKIFGENIGRGGGKYWNAYRPLQLLSYMIDYRLWKMNASGYHCINVLFHVFLVCALFWLIILLFDDRILALGTSLLYLVYPLHTGAVSYISGRADSLVGLFLVLSLILYIKYQDNKKVHLLVLLLISYVFALLSRENALVFIFLILWYHYVFKKRVSVVAFSLVGALSVAYIIVRLTLLRSMLVNITYPTSMLERLPGFFVALTTYARLSIFPYNLHSEYGNRLFTFSHPYALSGIALSIFLISVLFIAKKKNRIVFFALGWFLLMLAPLSNLYPLNAYMAEHWLYLPSLGFCLIIAAFLKGMYTIERLKKIALLFFSVFFVCYSFLAYFQNFYWSNPISFYKKTLQYVPDSAGLQNNLGLLYYEKGDFENALIHYKKAITLNPLLAEVHNNLGAIQSAQSNYQGAIESYLRAIELKSDYAAAYNNLGNAHKHLGNKIQTLALYARAVELDPENFQIHRNLAQGYKDLDDIKSAIEHIQKAISLNPSYAVAHYDLAMIYFRNSQYSLALEHCKRAGELGFDNSPLLKMLRFYESKIQQ